MKITVNSDNIIRKWPRVEAYQNSTLRYTSPKDFPAYCATKLGAPKVIRTWVTLDEVWDYRTDTYNWDYDIGVNNYVDDKNHYTYDWGITVPLGQKFIEYLHSYCAAADEVLFNIRRYEREVTDGIVSLEKYEEVVEKVIEYYKQVEPKIGYIECSNEVELGSFGGLTMAEYYPLYQATYRAVRRLNAKYNYDIPLKVGGFAMSGCMGRWNIWHQFLKLMAADDSPEKMIDFYSMHDYNPNIWRIMDFTIRHEEAVRQLGLPEVPLFFNEYGNCGCTGVLTDSLKNASGNIAGMILSSHLPNTHVFPWCTFHNPKLQMSYTQFLDLGDGKYAPTPNGNAMIALHMLAENEVEIWENTEYKAVACADDEKITLLVTNPTDNPMEVDAEIRPLSGYKAKVTQYLCDSTHNNRVTGEPAEDFLPTSESWMKVDGRGSLNVKLTLEPRAFVFVKVEK